MPLLSRHEVAKPLRLIEADERRTERALRAGSNYQPLASVWAGEDAELLERMLRFYPHKAPERILDATVNIGRFWVGSEREVIGLDTGSQFKPTVLGDNRCMPFASETFDIVVYDPPHVPNQGADKQKDFTERFGLGQKSGRENGYNFSHLYPGFLAEAYRVLKPDGMLFCKVTDYVHNHRYQWAHVELISAAIKTGLVPCDLIIKVRNSPIIDPKWKAAHHARHQHCYWLVFRKSTKCE